MPRKVDPWKQEKVAAAQRDLVLRQLKQPETIAPFAAFITTMRALELRGEPTLLDVGCGVGHYGVVCARFFPAIAYHGVDYSRPMIDEARALCKTGQFHIKEFDKTNFWDYDIVLVSQVLEYQPEPFAALAHALSKKHRGYVILHRLRLTAGASHKVESEACYCGYTAPNYEWNQGELIAFVGDNGGLVKRLDKWDNSATLVIVDRK